MPSLFVKKLTLIFCLLVIVISCKNEKIPEDISDIFVLPVSTPEAQGISSDTIQNLLKSIAKSGEEFHSLMVLRHGHIITEAYWNPYQENDKQQLYSLSKSFTSSAIGFAVDADLLSVDDPIIKFFPEELPDSISKNLANLKVKHLLSMSVGHGEDAIRILEGTSPGQTWSKTFLNLPVVFEPGTQFMYNSGASYMLANIVQKVTGQSAHEYLKTRLYKPLNIKNATWTANEEGINMGASHLRITTKDLASFGQFYLQNGKWNGKQILSENWVKEASSKQISNGDNNHSWGYGYGYQFWLNPPGGFRADGAFGQYSMIFPDKDMVVVITSESNNTATTMQLIWDMVENISGNNALAENKEAYNHLQKSIESLKYDSPKLNVSSKLGSDISGKEFLLETNPFKTESVTFNIEDDEILLTLKTEDKPDIVINCGINEWIRGNNAKPEAHSLFSLRRIDFDSKIAASATWQDDKTLILTWRFMETTHGDQLICTFNEDKVNIKFRYSLARMKDQEDGRDDLNGKL